ncbi:MAG: protoporphyrinogen oxidase HemJ [Alphaproteobacteria bacterium]|nr:protoporphyrinogen oxidase HemJ [Alphaproteobacteria bacterium]MBL6938996.1 protoporphyrinogen oxidase HemJ [Alphaproteobacteria bacterium]MBL7099588.1 protoporphyrinogen oxidase HemJ [Alphaproteobacteria bacterium]
MFLSNYIDWIKAFHVMAVIAWMAGMLYLPRLFVYHTEVAVGSPESEMLKQMEHRLLRIIVNPSMIAVWILGLTLAWVTGAYEDTWFQIKFVLVVLMSGLHGFFASTVKRFARDANTRSTRFYRIINEVPFLLIIGIVIMVIVQPFG